LATLLLAVAAMTDLGKRRIPNALNAALGLTGLWAQASARGWLAMAYGLLAGVMTVALLWVPWTKGRIGGGDVKMAGGAAIWMGLSLWPAFLLFTALAGGIVAVICYLLSARAARREIRNNLVAAAHGAGVGEVPLKGGAGRVSVPYGVAVAMSALAILWTGGRW
jgi:prepilin peptidase CpaA